MQPDCWRWLGAGVPILSGMVPTVGILLAISWVKNAWFPGHWRPVTTVQGPILVLAGVWTIIWSETPC
ncbi:hypothetical protein [Halodesulfurarchaeum sp.]|uniref:hypothetical protein n=1 Tax=Halodesulfurarchaeum sp. TaxID=1980530 RepID=UPI002FC32AEF